MQNNNVDFDLNRLDDLEPRNTVDTLLRNTQQHHVQNSAIADVKANIIITAASIVLTLALSHIGNQNIQKSLFILCTFIFFALIFAILAVLPKFRHIKWRKGMEKTEHFNILFFAFFSSMPLHDYLEEMTDILKDNRKVYLTAMKDIYSLGCYLDKHKYRYLRYSYLCFLTGFVLATAYQVIQMLH